VSQGAFTIQPSHFALEPYTIIIYYRLKGASTFALKPVKITTIIRKKKKNIPTSVVNYPPLSLRKIVY
jgi:hypothetical protein